MLIINQHSRICTPTMNVGPRGIKLLTYMSVLKAEMAE